MTRATLKNQINTILRNATTGLHCDDYWKPVNDAWNAIRAAGFELNLTGSRYGSDDKGNLIEKVWTYQIDMGTKKPLFGVLTCHGAGTVADPLSKYDISAYVS